MVVRELAKQWFGMFMRPKAPVDGWLVLGLCSWLEGQFVKHFMGKNELAYRYISHIYKLTDDAC